MSEDHVKEFIRSAKTVFSKKLHKTLSSSRGRAVDPPLIFNWAPMLPLQNCVVMSLQPWAEITDKIGRQERFEPLFLLKTVLSPSVHHCT